MGSGTLRGALEWSGGKDLYMESCCRSSGKIYCFGIVPGSFQKLPEGSRGVRKSTSGFHQHLGRAWAVGGALALLGQAHQPPQGPCAWEGETLSGRESTCLGRQVSSLGRLPSLEEGLGLRPQPSHSPIYSGEGAQGVDTPNPSLLSLPISLHLDPSALGEALSVFRCHYHHHAVVFVQISSTYSPSLAGSRRRMRPRAGRVLNSEVPHVRCLDRIGSRREYDYANHDL